MAKNMKGTGVKENNMAMELLFFKMEKEKKEYGKMEKESNGLMKQEEMKEIDKFT